MPNVPVGGSGVVLLPPSTETKITGGRHELNQAEIRALLDLIEFHEDWDECSEQLGVDVAQLYDKVSALVTY